MNRIFERIVSFTKRELLFKKLNSYQKTSVVVSRFKFADSYSVVEEERDLFDSEYLELSNKYFNVVANGHRTFVIQPYIKWGVKKKRNTNKFLQLDESVALVNTLPYWSVIDKICIPLLSFNQLQLFGKGNLELLKKRIRSADNITAVFISTNTLSHEQILKLQSIFGLPIYDRYSLVIHIFKSHAKSPEAKLQVAIAELPYIWKKMSEVNGRINLLEKRKLYLQNRESKLKAALEKVSKQREVIRIRRKKHGIATVAIVGYTNAGKTSVIKALTNNSVLQPKSYMFATLDTSSYEGTLPCKMKILYIDTIGFIQDVPETLLAPFITTLQDAMVADVIVHVYDVSHPDKEAQIDYVRKTLHSLIDEDKPLIEVANKCDLINLGTLPDDTFGISAMQLTGIDSLRYNLQELILKKTGRSITKMRVESGSDTYFWLHQETTILGVEVDPKDSQFLLLDVVTTGNFLHRFRYYLKHSRQSI